MWCLQKWQIKIKAQNAAERRGENPFKGGKRNSAFWAILTTLDPVAVVGPGEEKGQEGGGRKTQRNLLRVRPCLLSSLARDTACQKLENRNGNTAFPQLGMSVGVDIFNRLHPFSVIQVVVCTLNDFKLNKQLTNLEKFYEWQANTLCFTYVLANTCQTL